MGVKSTVWQVSAGLLPSNQERVRVGTVAVDFGAKSRTKVDLGHVKNFVSHPKIWFLKVKRGVRHY